MSGKSKLPYAIPADVEDRRDEFWRANQDAIISLRSTARRWGELELAALMLGGLTVPAAFADILPAWPIIVSIIVSIAGFLRRSGALGEAEGREGKNDDVKSADRRIWYFQDLVTVTRGEVDSMGPRVAALRTETAEDLAKTEQLQLTVELDLLKRVTEDAMAGRDVSSHASPDLPVVNGSSAAELELDLGPLAYESNTWKVIDHIEAELLEIELMFRNAATWANLELGIAEIKADVILGKRCATCNGGDHPTEDCIADVVEVYAWSSDQAVRTFAVPGPIAGYVDPNDPPTQSDRRFVSSLNPNDHSFFTQRGIYRGHPGL